MRAKLLLCLLFIVTTPSIASATDYTGLLTIAAMVLIVFPGTLINLLVTVGFAVKRRYASRDFALKHSWYGSIVPIVGALLVMHDHSGYGARHLTSERNLFLCIHAGLLLLAWLPMLLHRWIPSRAHPAREL